MYSSFQSWFTQSCLTLARAQISPRILSSDPWWQYLHETPDFLFLPGAKIGVRFLLSHFIGVDRLPGCCLFCSQEEGDCGFHLCLECSALPEEALPRPFNIDNVEGRKKMRLINSQLDENKLVLMWMNIVYKLRAERFEIAYSDRSKLPKRADISTHNHFMSPYEKMSVSVAHRFSAGINNTSTILVRPALVSRLRELLTSTNIIPFRFAATPHLWSRAEMSALKVSLQHGYTDFEVLAGVITTRSMGAIAQKCRYGEFRVLLDAWKSQGHNHTSSGKLVEEVMPVLTKSADAELAENCSRGKVPMCRPHWSDEEKTLLDEKLAAEPYLNAADLKNIISTKSRKQIADRIAYIRRKTSKQTAAAAGSESYALRSRRHPNGNNKMDL
jgi:hypothetical protein